MNRKRKMAPQNIFINKESDFLLITFVQGPINIPAYINKFVFEKILSRIEKVIKIFLILDKTFSKNGILLCAIRTHVSKILYTMHKCNSFDHQGNMVGKFLASPGL